MFARGNESSSQKRFRAPLRFPSCDDRAPLKSPPALCISAEFNDLTEIFTEREGKKRARESVVEFRVPIKRDALVKRLPTLGNKSISMNFPRNSSTRDFEELLYKDSPKNRLLEY